MAYRLKRKRFTCDLCVREWNQLVGADINSVKCDNCSRDSRCLNHDVPAQNPKTF